MENTRKYGSKEQDGHDTENGSKEQDVEFRRPTTTRTFVKCVVGVRLTIRSLRTCVKREGGVRLTISRLRQLRATCSSSCCA